MHGVNFTCLFLTIRPVQWAKTIEWANIMINIIRRPLAECAHCYLLKELYRFIIHKNSVLKPSNFWIAHRYSQPIQFTQHPLWTKHMIKLNRQTERIGWMVDLDRVEWAKVYLMQLILTSVSMNILKLSSSQSLFRFKSLISSSVGYTSVIYVRDCSSKAIIFPAALTMRLVSSSLFSSLFWNQPSFTMEFAVSLFAALPFDWATKPFSIHTSANKPFARKPKVPGSSPTVSCVQRRALCSNRPAV